MVVMDELLDQQAPVLEIKNALLVHIIGVNWNTKKIFLYFMFSNAINSKEILTPE